MKKSLLTFAVGITSTAIASSLYLASLENPTDIQKQLSTTTNAISIAGTTAIFGLLDDEPDDRDCDRLEGDSDDKNCDR